MKSKYPILWVSIRFGLVAAILSILLFSVLYFGGRNPLLIPAFLDFRLLLFPVFIVFAIRDFREYRNQGFLHFWQGFSIGSFIVMLIGISMALYILLLGGIIDTDFTRDYIAATTGKIMEARERIIAQVGESAFKKSLELLPGTSLLDLSLDYFLKCLPPGFILTILITLILRNNQK